jgi:hypothetical protein
MPEMKIGQSFPEELAKLHVSPSYWWDPWTGEVTFLPEVPQPIRDVVLAVLTRHQPLPPADPYPPEDPPATRDGRKPAR